MYAGVILTAMGAGLIFRTWGMLLFTVSAFSVILRARLEEELLEKRFGACWVGYRERVPGWWPSRKRTPDEVADYTSNHLPHS